jgi:Predicted membrane protein (DUF2142)
MARDPQSTERKLVLLLCLAAAVRVFLFSAAFPFFNNVDEQPHVDLVMKYARGDFPRELSRFSAESASYFVLYGTPEYFLPAARFDTGRFPPPNWTLPDTARENVLRENTLWWQSQQNHESGEPPLYYALAGLWLNLGRVCGISGGALLYWIRFFNVWVAAACVWVGFLAARRVFPNRELVRVGVPLLLAVWPQTVFYSVQSDVLSPLCFGIAFLGLVKLLESRAPNLFLGIWTGLAVAATCLVKTSNLPLLAVAVLTVVFKTAECIREGKGTLRMAWAPLTALLVFAAVPIAAWFAWNNSTFGDVTAANAKIEFLGWTRKPLGSWWPHPLFTLHGLNEFWRNLLASFWRGEFTWHGQRLAGATSDAFYWISSTVAAGAGVVLLVGRGASLTSLQRQSLSLALSSFAALLAFLVFLSVAFDFGACAYPSREHPYFTSGRLLGAAAIPFFVLYAEALDWAVHRLRRRCRLVLFVGIILFVSVAQIVVNWPAFASAYNFFHLASVAQP